MGLPIRTGSTLRIILINVPFLIYNASWFTFKVVNVLYTLNRLFQHAKLALLCTMPMQRLDSIRSIPSLMSVKYLDTLFDNKFMSVFNAAMLDFSVRI